MAGNYCGEPEKTAEMQENIPVESRNEIETPMEYQEQQQQPRQQEHHQRQRQKQHRHKRSPESSGERSGKLQKQQQQQIAQNQQLHEEQYHEMQKQQELLQQIEQQLQHQQELHAHSQQLKQQQQSSLSLLPSQEPCTKPTPESPSSAGVGGLNSADAAGSSSSLLLLPSSIPSTNPPDSPSAVGGGAVTPTGAGSSSSWLDGSDSCPSISPSPGADGGDSFVFGDDVSGNFGGATEELSAALQAEKEFLDFMCSLPQVQEHTTRLPDEYETPPPKEEVVSSLDHLGHLCRVVEQLAGLKEQNVRLQRRVQYLEDLRLLHQMHRQMTETLSQEQETSSQLQYNDPRICRTVSQDSIRLSESALPAAAPNNNRTGSSNNNNNTAAAASTAPPLPPSSRYRPSLPGGCVIPHQPPHHYITPSSGGEGGGRGGGGGSGGNRRRGTVGDTAAIGVINNKDKKGGHKSAWGKVKHIIINTRKDNKKTSPSRLPHSKSALCSASPTATYVPAHDHGNPSVSPIGETASLSRGDSLREGSVASSDPEDYDIDYESMYLLNDPNWDPSDPDGDLAGIWMGPKDLREPKEEIINSLPTILQRPNSSEMYPPAPVCTSLISTSADPISSNPLENIPPSERLPSVQSTSPSSVHTQDSAKISPLLLSSTSPSTTSSVSPTTPPSSSSNSQGLPSGSPLPSPSANPQDSQCDNFQGIPSGSSISTHSSEDILARSAMPSLHVSVPDQGGLSSVSVSAQDISEMAVSEDLGVPDNEVDHGNSRKLGVLGKQGSIAKGGRFKPHLTVTVPSTEDLSKIKPQDEMKQLRHKQQQIHQQQHQHQSRQTEKVAHDPHQQSQNYQQQQYQQFQEHQQQEPSSSQQSHNSNWNKVKNAFLSPTFTPTTSDSNFTTSETGGKESVHRSKSSESRHSSGNDPDFRKELDQCHTKESKVKSDEDKRHRTGEEKRIGNADGGKELDEREEKSEGTSLDAGSYGAGSLPPSPNNAAKSVFVFDDYGEQASPGTPDQFSLRPPSSGNSRHPSGGSSTQTHSPMPGTSGSGGIGSGASSITSGGGGSSSMTGASPPAHGIMAAGGAVGRNLAELQKALSGEFSKKIHEWEKLKGQQWLYGGGGGVGGSGGPTAGRGAAGAPGAAPSVAGGHQLPEGNLPQEFRKKLQEWEKMKEKERLHGGGLPMCASPSSSHQGGAMVPDNIKTRKHGEDSLPPEFRKRLTEWEIGKVLAGKSRQNIEELQKKLGEEFNRKLAEWERIKAASGGSGVVHSAADSPGLGVTEPLFSGMAALDRKGSAHKMKKSKLKTDKQIVGKVEALPKLRDKDIQWLERELNKIEREKQRLEREKEKYMEREARLESIWQAYRQGQAPKREVLIKTSTGEFRFEGISQTFTKRLFEWEERRGIRPESSTIALLAPSLDYTCTCSSTAAIAAAAVAATAVTVTTAAAPSSSSSSTYDAPASPDITRMARCKSESSVAELVGGCSGGGLPSIPSTLSLSDKPTAGDTTDIHGVDDQNNIGEVIFTSEPTLQQADDKLPTSVSQTKLISGSPPLSLPPSSALNGKPRFSRSATYTEDATDRIPSSPLNGKPRPSRSTTSSTSDTVDKLQNELQDRHNLTETTNAAIGNQIPVSTTESRLPSGDEYLDDWSSGRPSEIFDQFEPVSYSGEPSSASRIPEFDGPKVVEVIKGRRKGSVSRQSSGRSLASLKAAYAPAEITRLIDSSDSDDEGLRRRISEKDFTGLPGGGSMLRPPRIRNSDSLRSESSYHEMMQSISMIKEITTHEVACRTLDAQMEDLDSKMDSVTDQHIKTLEKLHEQVTIMKDSVAATAESDSTYLDGSIKTSETLSETDLSTPDIFTSAAMAEYVETPNETSKQTSKATMNEVDEEDRTLASTSQEDLACDEASEEKSLEECGDPLPEDSQSKRDQENQLLITHLRERIMELEERGESLLRDKEKLDAAFQHHKERETTLAQSLLLRMRDLHAAEADWNACSPSDILPDDHADIVLSATSHSREDIQHPDTSVVAPLDADDRLSIPNQDSTVPSVANEPFSETPETINHTSNRKSKSFKRQNRIHDEEDKISASCDRKPEQYTQSEHEKFLDFLSAELKSSSSVVQDSYNRDDFKGKNEDDLVASDDSYNKVRNTTSESRETNKETESLFSRRSVTTKCAEMQTDTLERRHDESERIRSVRKKCKEGVSNSEKRSSSRREKSKSNSNSERKRRSRQGNGDEGDSGTDDDDKNEDHDKAMRKRRKTPTKKVMKLHNLTADLLFQAKRLEQALVSKHHIPLEDVSTAAAVTQDAVGAIRGLRGRSSLRLVGETPVRQPRHHPRVPGQTRTWSSIETIAAPSEAQVVRSSHGPRGSNSPPSRVSSQPDLLALNAEISRMAKELRLQMMDLWTFRESTSPESVTSDRDEGSRRLEKVNSIEDKTEARRRLFHDAQEVFNSIASLRRSNDSPSPTSPRTPSSPLPSSLSFKASGSFPSSLNSPGSDHPHPHLGSPNSPRGEVITSSNSSFRDPMCLDLSNNFRSTNNSSSNSLSGVPAYNRPVLTSSNSLSLSPVQGFSKLSLSPPTLNRKQRSHHSSKGGVLRPSFTAPSLASYERSKLDSKLSPLKREAWSLDLDEHFRKDDVLCHWVAGANSRAHSIRKGSSIEEEEDDNTFENTTGENKSSVANKSKETLDTQSSSPQGGNEHHIVETPKEKPRFYLSDENISSPNETPTRQDLNNKERPSNLNLSAKVVKLEIIESPDDIPGRLSPRNLPDLNELLPKGPNTTFADLVRVHDQLHQLELHKKALKDIAAKSKAKQKNEASTKPKDFLQEGFQNIQKAEKKTEEPFSDHINMVNSPSAPTDYHEDKANRCEYCNELSCPNVPNSMTTSIYSDPQQNQNSTNTFQEQQRYEEIPHRHHQELCYYQAETSSVSQIDNQDTISNVINPLPNVGFQENECRDSSCGCHLPDVYNCEKSLQFPDNVAVAHHPDNVAVAHHPDNVIVAHHDRQFAQSLVVKPKQMKDLPTEEQSIPQSKSDILKQDQLYYHDHDENLQMENHSQNYHRRSSQSTSRRSPDYAENPSTYHTWQPQNQRVNSSTTLTWSQQDQRVQSSMLESKNSHRYNSSMCDSWQPDEHHENSHKALDHYEKSFLLESRTSHEHHVGYSKAPDHYEKSLITVSRNSHDDEQEKSFMNRDPLHSDDKSSLCGTWKTSASNRSFDHVLSSSFEWGDHDDNLSQNTDGKKTSSLSRDFRVITSVDVNRYTTTDSQPGEATYNAISKKCELYSVSSSETAEQRQQRSQFETEVTSEHIHTSLGRLRTRRVSDTQVEYHETSGRKVHRKASSCNTETSNRNVFVATKRIFFTPTSIALATPTFLQALDEHSLQFVQSPPESTNLELSNTRTAHEVTNPSLAQPNNMLVALTIPHNMLQQESYVDSNDDGFFKSSLVHSSVENLVKDLSHNLSISEETLIPAESPFVWHGLSVPGPVSPTVESKRRILEAANKSSGETSPTVKGMIEQYNKRITERQSLLTSPFKYWISDISSPVNVRKSAIPSHLTATSTSVVKSSSAIRMPICTPSPDILQGIQKFASGPTWHIDNKRVLPLTCSPADTSLDTSVDEVQVPGARAFKIKKAKEEFFSRKNPPKRNVSNRNSYDSTDTASKDSLYLTDQNTPSPQPAIVISEDVDMNEKPPITGLRRSSTPRKESIRRESAGAVVKSASSGIVNSRQQHPIRPSSTEPTIHTGKSSRGIFKLFRRSKEKDRKEMNTVQRLCRHSLEVDVETIDRRKEKRPSSTRSELAVSGCVDSSGNRQEARTTNTFPRPNNGSADGPSSRSCPSSPVFQHKNRAASWLAKGKELLKRRSPSPTVSKSTR